MPVLENYFRSKAAKMLRNRGFTSYVYGGKVKIKLPKGVQNFSVETGSSVLELVDKVEAMFRPKEQLYEDPPDAAVIQKSGMFPEEKLPENYENYIFPATKRPNVDRIKLWIQEVKFDGKTNEELLNEYNDLKGRAQDTALTARQRHDLADSTAFKISRKIWYVGRRPSSLTDSEWDELTRRMRPPKGSYSKNEKWTNVKFPYTQSYRYTSGVT